jgi:hypothetical protein
MKEKTVRRVLAAVVMSQPCTFPKGFVLDHAHKINDPVASSDIRPEIVDAVLARLESLRP